MSPCECNGTYLITLRPRVFRKRVADHADPKRQNDGGRHADGRLSAAERDAQLLPKHHIQRRGHQGGRGLLTVRAGPPGTGPLSLHRAAADVQEITQQL